MAKGPLAKAKMTNVVTGETVPCMFNPTDYTFSKSNDWSEQKSEKQNVSNLQFGGGSGATLELVFFFDTYEAHGNFQAGTDVRTYTKGLWDMMKVSSSGEPPTCRFEWGSFWSFEGVITSITQKFTFFDSDGTPLRSTLTVAFKQNKDEGVYPPQNPTSGGHPGEHLRTVRQGETLAGIAYDEYGDPTLWRHIAQANAIRDPRRLRAGQALLIVPLPQIVQG